MTSTRAQVAAAVLRRDDTFLLGLRTGSRAAYPSVWDLPGGHVDHGETPAQAVRRELIEELGVEIDVRSSHLLTTVERPTVSMSVFVVDSWTGTPQNADPEEHDDIRWFSLADLESLDLADAAYPALLQAAVEWQPETP